VELSHWIERHGAFAPQKLALRFAGEDLTYADLAARVERVAGILATLGVRQADRVAFLGLNNPLLLVLLFACARLGATLVPLNWRLAPPEHAWMLADCTPQVLFVEPAFIGHVTEIEASLKSMKLVSLGAAPEGWLPWDELQTGTQPTAPRVGGEDSPLLLCYTSGTTGLPKGVVLAQRALYWNAVNSAHLHDLTSEDRVLTTLPLFHVGGLNIQTTPALHAGASVVLHAKFDPAATIDAIEAERVTLAVLVPAQLVAMMESPRWQAADFSSLRMIVTGSTIVPESFVGKVGARGIPVVQVYGSTETCPIAGYVRTEDWARKAGSAGLPALHSELRVVDEKGRDLPAGQDGEILVRGPNVMTGYWNAPERTREALEDGWYHSGDIGHFDEDGYLFVASRKTELIISGGENVYPAEVERLLLESPSIQDACVVGRPDERWGEVVVAAVVLKPGVQMSAADVANLFQGRIARYKQPREIHFVSSLPRNALGKVQRNQVLKK
jgi:fatty-acyl-CoA synthase